MWYLRSWRRLFSYLERPKTRNRGVLSIKIKLTSTISSMPSTSGRKKSKGHRSGWFYDSSLSTFVIKTLACKTFQTQTHLACMTRLPVCWYRNCCCGMFRYILSHSIGSWCLCCLYSGCVWSHFLKFPIGHCSLNKLKPSKLLSPICYMEMKWNLIH